MNLKSIFSLCNVTPERAVNAQRQKAEKAIYTSFFARNEEEEKRQKEIL